MKNRVTIFIYLSIALFFWSTASFARLSDSGSEVVALGAINNNSSFKLDNVYLRAAPSQQVVVDQAWKNNEVGTYRLYLIQGDLFPVTADVIYEDFDSHIAEKQCQIDVIAHDNGLVEMKVRQLPSFIHCAVDAENNIIFTDNFSKKRLGK